MTRLFARSRFVLHATIPSLLRTALFCALLLPCALRGEVSNLGASKDNTLYEDPAGAVSNGAGDRFFVGRTDLNGGGRIRRGVIAFDLSSIPAGSVVNSVTLTLYMSRTEVGAENVTLHRVLANWGEGTSNANAQEGRGANSTTGDATWIHRFYNSLFWANPGGNFAVAASGTTSVNAVGFYTWSSAGLVTDVQLWVNNAITNFGWIVKGNEATPATAKRFESRQSATTSQRPVLTVNFTPPATTGACCLTNGACSVLTSSQCAAQGGTFQGNGSSCTPNPCPQPPAMGACCFTNGACDELTASGCASLGGNYQGDGVACTSNLCPVVLTPFVDALPIPGVLQPVSGAAGGQAHYEIAITQFTQKLHRDLPTTTVWGFAGSYPGPTIETTRNLPITVEWINDLRDLSGNLRTNHYLPVDLCLDGPDTEGDSARVVFHLHGGHVPPESDGYPEDTILPGGTDTYYYPNTQLPATLWYHDHALGITRLNVYMGLAGFYLVRDSVEAALGLPAGEFEIPLAIQDRMFHGDGSLQYPAAWDEHFFGDKVLVNGKVWPFLNVKKGKYRFRMLNGSNSRTYTLGLSSGATFHQIGTDGGLLSAPAPLSSLTLSPGERADVIMDFASYATGTEIVLTNSAPAPYPGNPGVGVIPNVMKFVVQAATGHTNALPSVLRPIETLSESNSVFTREMTLRKQSDDCTGAKWQINDLGWHDITDFPVLGTTEIWSFINRSGVVHPMHMHLVMFQVLDRQSFTVISNQIVTTGPRVAPPANEAGWKDTARANAFTITRVIARFEGFAGKYPYHCHVLEHEDQEMMRQFQIVPRGDVNGDTHVTGADSLLINQVLVNLRSATNSVFHGSGFLNGDINATTNVSGADSLLMNQSLVGLRPYIVTDILPHYRTNIAPTPVTIFGINFPTNATPAVTIGLPVNLTLSNVVVISREEISATVPMGGGLGTGTVNVLYASTNGVISFGRFINR